MKLIKSLFYASLCFLSFSYTAYADEAPNKKMEAFLQEPTSSYKDNVISSSETTLPIESNIDVTSLSKALELTAATNKRVKEVHVETTHKDRGPKESAVFEQIAAGTLVIQSGTNSGSGALITENGHIITNQHVVGDAEFVYVFFKPVGKNTITDEERIRAEVVKVDVPKDLALLKIDTVPSHARPIALSNKAPKVGEDAHAIGHPKDQYWTYTKGYISAIRDNYRWLKHKAKIIQTQTPINPGNSGGPLVSDDRRLIGINSFILTGNPGLNYAISVDEVKTFLKQKESKTNSNSEIGIVIPVKKKCGKDVVFKRGTKTDSVNGVHEFVAYDTKCTGKVDMIFIVPSNPIKPFTLKMDTNDDEKWDVYIVDTNRDGRWDFSFYDTDHDNRLDLTGYHRDGRIAPSSVGVYRYKIRDFFLSLFRGD